MNFDEWRLSSYILVDLIEILQAERGQRRVAKYLTQAVIAVFIKNIESFTWDEDTPTPSSFEVLRRVTKPATDAKVMEIVKTRYGRIRDNIGSDDPALATQLSSASKRVAAKRATKAVETP